MELRLENEILLYFSGSENIECEWKYEKNTKAIKTVMTYEI